MRIFVDNIADQQSHRLLKDLQDAGFIVAQHNDDMQHVNLVLLTPKAVDAQSWKAFDESTKPTILIKIRPCDVPAENVIDLTTDYTTGYQNLLTHLQNIAQEQKLSPYKGLLPYGNSDAAYFFGREALVQRLLQSAQAGRQVIALLGESGSGKTSTLGAGFIPALQASEQTWISIYIQLESSPIQQIARRLELLFPGHDGLVSRLETNLDALGQVLQELTPPDTQIALILDAFENVFTRFSLADRIYFLDALYRAVSMNERKLLIVLSLRSDFQKRLLDYPKWAAFLQANQFNMARPTTEDLVAIITKPAQWAGVILENELADHIAEEALHGSEINVLPHLSFTLAKLFELNDLSLSAYHSIGGIRGAFEQYVEVLYQNLTSIQQLLVRRILVLLVDILEDGQPVARVLERNRFTLTWAKREEVDGIIDLLIRTQLLRETIDAYTNEVFLGLTHEVIPLTWKRYATWIEDDKTNLRYASGLERMAEDWIGRGYTDEALIKGTILDEARLWVQDPDHLPSPLLQDYVEMSLQLRKSIETQQTERSKIRRRTLAILAGMVGLLAVVAVGIGIFSIRTLGERNSISTLQAGSTSQYATAVVQNATVESQRNGFATGEADAQNQVSTSVAQYEAAATAQSEAETLAAVSASTIQALSEQQSANATSIAEAEELQSTAQAALNQVATAQVQAQSTAVEAQQQLRSYLANNLAKDVDALLKTNPQLALRLAAEAGSIAFTDGNDTTNGLAGEALRNALEANATLNLGDGVTNSWFLGNHHVVIDFAEKPDELWQINPPQLVATLSGPIGQVLPLAGGMAFIVDYADDTPDEIWTTEDAKPGVQLKNDVAPAFDPAQDINTPNLVQLQNATYFILKYENNQPSDLFEVATLNKIASLNGDYEEITPLADGHFFVRYTDLNIPGGIWEITSGQQVQPADDVITEPYNNSIFVLRRNGEFDEIWRTDPFAKLTQIVGRATTVTDIQGNPYFIVQYAGGQPAQIWRTEEPVEVAYTFSGDIDVSVTFLGRKYFVVRYADGSPTELWGTDPLQVITTFNGSILNLDLDLILDEQALIVDYVNNTISELWSVPDGKRLAQLNGNLEKAISILGDVYFVVRYEGNQPAEVWSAVDGALVGTLGSQSKHVKDVIPLKGGTYLFVIYDDAPAEIWQVNIDKLDLLSTLPDVVSRTFLVENGDYLVIDFLNNLAQIWQLDPSKPIATLTDDVLRANYNPEDKRLNYADANNQIYSVDFSVYITVNNQTEPLTDSDLLSLSCERLASLAPISDDDLAVYLAGLPPSACLAPP